MDEAASLALVRDPYPLPFLSGIARRGMHVGSTESPSAAGEKGIFAIENKALLMFASTASETTRGMSEHCANHTSG